MNRPEWAEANDLLRHYYDTEWGFPVTSAAGVYERIVLEGFQSGLSWETILKKRAGFRAAYSGFDVELAREVCSRLGWTAKWPCSGTRTSAE